MQKLRSVVVVVPQDTNIYIHNFYGTIVYRPYVLREITFSSLERLKFYHDNNMSVAERREIHHKMVDNYHIQKRVKDPIAAVDELAQRVFYEFLIGVVDISHFETRHTWVDKPKRDARHQLRIKILLSCICKAKIRTDMLYSWLI
jgi:hypothetical protein